MINAWIRYGSLSLAFVASAAFAVEPVLIGHRGASYDAPENTLAAFRAAWEQGADGVEADFYLSSDGQIVCIHDADTERVAGVKRLVEETPLNELSQLDVGKWKDARWTGERIATLDQVLAVIPSGKTFVIELKVGPDIVKPMLAALAASEVSPEQVAVISFREDTIAEVERLAPQLRTHWLSGYKEDDTGKLRPNADEVVSTIQRIHADGFGSDARTAQFNRDFIEKLRDGGCEEFHVWTVDDPLVAKHFQELGAKWITTNRPGKLRQQMRPANRAGEPASD